ncbi:AraC family ligand binding domain-containing protein [Xanthocytophaga agilis]|uniref:AraC family ligand binding domain-containing protein n=1 Tax=Xanthocytophaga agilis TaxID=3048010 RepID=A0AAE3R821_9BACT|nr:AraC family ligand binding domain-containing protein [Xanthocytophaga agilis]MDJ1503104.1 AraC family ligand binding domain-containing protein [Xanthocytophaga agilis]
MKTQNSLYKRIRLSTLDNLELLIAKEYTDSFPAHSHNTFCLSLIDQGTFSENNILATPGTIHLTPPDKLHTNELVHESGYSFKTFYISPDLLKSLHASQPIYFEMSVISDPELYNSFQEIVQDFGNQSPAPIGALQEIVKKLLIRYAVDKPEEEKYESATIVRELQMYIHEHLEEKISLELLACRARLGKFKLLRLFQKYTGLSLLLILFFSVLKKPNHC